MTDNRMSMQELYARMAKLVSLRSTCKRQQNGAVITSTDMRRVLSIGYNGSPRNTEHCHGGEPGTCGCIHAELNALLKKYSPEPAVMFLTTSPCIECAKAIIQANIVKVYFINYYRDTVPLSALDKLKIYCQQISVPEIPI